METLDKWLKIMRIKEDLNLKTFAEKMGFNSSAYASGIESGRIKPSKDFIDKLLRTFPQYANERQMLETLIEQNLETFNDRKDVSTTSLKLARKIETLPKDKQQFIFSKVDELIKKAEKDNEQS